MKGSAPSSSSHHFQFCCGDNSCCDYVNNTIWQLICLLISLIVFGFVLWGLRPAGVGRLQQLWQHQSRPLRPRRGAGRRQRRPSPLPASSSAHRRVSGQTAARSTADRKSADEAQAQIRFRWRRQWRRRLCPPTNGRLSATTELRPEPNPRIATFGWCI